MQVSAWGNNANDKVQVTGVDAMKAFLRDRCMWGVTVVETDDALFQHINGQRHLPDIVLLDLAFSEKVNLQIMEQLEAEGISFAAPALTVHTEEQIRRGLTAEASPKNREREGG